MSTLIVYGKGAVAGSKLHSLVMEVKAYNTLTIVKPKWWQFKPRFVARFHNLTAQQIAEVKVKLAFVHEITKIDLI